MGEGGNGNLRRRGPPPLGPALPGWAGRSPRGGRHGCWLTRTPTRPSAPSTRTATTPEANCPSSAASPAVWERASLRLRRLRRHRRTRTTSACTALTAAGHARATPRTASWSAVLHRSAGRGRREHVLAPQANPRAHLSTHSPPIHPESGRGSSRPRVHVAVCGRGSGCGTSRGRRTRSESRTRGGWVCCWRTGRSRGRCTWFVLGGELDGLAHGQCCGDGVQFALPARASRRSVFVSRASRSRLPAAVTSPAKISQGSGRCTRCMASMPRSRSTQGGEQG